MVTYCWVLLVLLLFVDDDDDVDGALLFLRAVFFCARWFRLGRLFNAAAFRLARSPCPALIAGQRLRVFQSSVGSKIR